jgi:hypothetical protein
MFLEFLIINYLMFFNIKPYTSKEELMSNVSLWQNMTMLVEDLEMRNQKVVFWNWKRSAGVVCQGIDAKMSKYFNYEDKLESLLQGERQ